MRISMDLNACLKRLAHLRTHESTGPRDALGTRGEPTEPDGLYLNSLLDSVRDIHLDESMDRRMSLKRPRKPRGRGQRARA
jgi:hypothetical protein